MACGTPVIGSKVGGIKYTVKDQKTGFLVPPNNPEELADRISLLLENKEKQKEFSKAGIKRVYEHFTWEKVSLQLSNLYTEIISENEFLDEVLTFSICKTYKETFSTLLKSSKILIPHILKATQVITDALENGKKILICGNGGSASESQHFTAELIGRFQKPFRRALPAISLNADTSVITAWANDFDFSQIFSRQIEALGEKGDVLICLSTSGNSDNIIQAIKIANKKGITCLSLLGKDGGEAAKRSSVNIIIPSTDTARIQELHLNTIHVLCEAIEAKLFSSIPTDSETSEVVSIVNHQKLEQWKKKIIFLDKDGTIIPDIPYNVNPALISLYSGVSDSLPVLQKAGYEFIIVTNQSGIAKGYFSEQQLTQVKIKIEQLFANIGVSLLDFYYCPHEESVHTEKSCGCRKPFPGMLQNAALKHNLSLEDCWMIGDILNDVEAGNRASCKTILLDRGNESFDNTYGENRVPDIYALHFPHAVQSILNFDNKNKNYEKLTDNRIIFKKKSPSNWRLNH